MTTATAQPPCFDQHIGLVHMQAKFAFKMASLNNVTLDYDDCYQEASLAFLMAAQGYDPDSGFKFSTYYTKVAFSHFQKAIGRITGVKNLNAKQRAEIQARREENKRRAAAALPPLGSMQYGLRPVGFADLRALEDGTPFEESIAGPGVDPCQALEAKQAVERAQRRLSPLTRLVVEWLRNPPPELQREISAQLAFARCCESRGVRAPQHARKGLSVETIGRFLKLAGYDVDRAMTRVRRELQQLIEEVDAS